MNWEQIIPAISLIAVLILVLPAFLRTNSKLKQFLTNFKETRAGSGNATTDNYIKAQRPTSSRIYIDGVRFKNFNFIKMIFALS